MTLKELLELGIKGDIITEEEPSTIEGFKVNAEPDNTVIRNFTAKIGFCFSEDELENNLRTDLQAEEFLMHRTCDAGADIGCMIVYASEKLAVTG